MAMLLLLLSFLLGSIPVGYVIGSVYGVDVRRRGSGNVGTTNVQRLVGNKAAFLTLIGDLFKGGLCALLPYFFFGPLSSYSLFGSFSVAPVAFQSLCAFLAVLGHCFSPFLGFKGGKGVATSCGAFFVLSPLSALLCLLSFCLVAYLSRYVSLASMVSSLLLPVFIVFVENQGRRGATLGLAIGLAVLILLRHVPNIKRLLGGGENSLGNSRQSPS